VYSIDDQGTAIRLYYFLATDALTPTDFRSYQEQGKSISGNPVSQYRSTGVSMWATTAIARQMAMQRSRGNWRFVAGIALATDGKEIRIERTGVMEGHFTVFSTADVLYRCPRDLYSISGS